MRDIQNEGMGFGDGGLPVGIDFDDPATLAMQREAHLDLDASAITRMEPDSLLVLLRFIVAPGGGRCRWNVSKYRLILLAHLAGLEGVADLSLTELAKQLGCTRGLLSHYSIKIVDELEQAQTRGGKSRASREAYRKSATAAHRRLGHVMTDAPVTPGLAVAACA